MRLPVYKPDGSAGEDREFARFPVFEGEKGVAALRQVVLGMQANRRQGTASAKTRSEVRGTGKKPFRQKGTGMARQGSRRAPHHYGGAVAFGPKPRDYSQKLNRKMRRLALSRALFDRASEGNLAVIEAFQFEAPKTQRFDRILANVLPRGKVLVVDDAFERNTALSARNIERVSLAQAGDLSALELVRHRRILLSENAVNTLIARVNGGE